MKNSRKILMISLFMAMAITANAQLEWGMKAGLNLSTFSGLEAYADSAELTFQPGLHAGLTIQYMFTPQLGIETGLLYSMLGTKMTEYAFYGKGSLPSISDDVNLDYAECSFNPSYLQLPVSLLYKFKLADDLYLYPSLGLYFGFGIGGDGKWTVGYRDRVLIFSEPKEIVNAVTLFGKDEPGGDVAAIKVITKANRFDMGMTAGLTFQVNRVAIGLGFEQGLSRFDKEFSPEGIFGKGALKNRNIKVSIGYFF